MQEKIRVKLLVDLTKYGEGLVEGVEGYTVGERGMWSRASDRFVTVCFPGIATLDVLWQSLEIIDEEYLKRVEEADKKWFNQIKTAKNVELILGPRGGFRSLSFEYIGDEGVVNHYSVGFRDKAEKIMKFFKENKIKVREVREN